MIAYDTSATMFVFQACLIGCLIALALLLRRLVKDAKYDRMERKAIAERYKAEADAKTRAQKPGTFYYGWPVMDHFWSSATPCVSCGCADDVTCVECEARESARRV
jgi:hypothetical protein